MPSTHPQPVSTTQPDKTLALAAIADTLPDGLAVIDWDWRLVYANQRARQISHISESDLDRRLWEIWPEFIGQPFERAYRIAMDERVPQTLDAIYYPPFDAWFCIQLYPVEQGLAAFYRDISRERALETASSEASGRLAFAMAAANGLGTFDLDLEQQLLIANPRVAQLCGVDPERACSTGVSLEDFMRNLHPEDVRTVQSVLEEAIRSGREIQAEYRVLQPNGSIAFLGTLGRAHFDPLGKPLRFTGIVLDITTARRREHALRDSETRYRTLIDLSPNALWSADPAGAITYANQKLLDYIGPQLVPNEMAKSLNFFLPDSGEDVAATWKHSVTTGELFEIEAQMRRAADGELRWWHLRALPVRDENGVIQQWLGSAVDVHDEHTTRQQLAAQFVEIDRQRNELEVIYRNSPVAMSLYSVPDLRVLRINERAARNLGLSVAEVVGKTAFDLAPEMTSAHHLLRRAASGEAVLDQQLQGTLPTTGTQLRHFTVNYSPVLTDDGSVRSVASASLDITSQKDAEAALLHSEKLAVLGRMASSIAHEINNPLESVTNLLYITQQQSDLTDQTRGYLAQADQELRRISIIASQTLLFHKQAAAPSAVTPDQLFSTVLSLYEGRLRNSGVSVDKRFLCRKPFTCFEGDIRQVLINIVGNAIDAMARGGTLLLRCVEAVDLKSDSAGVRITIADTGTGISDLVQGHLFEAFYTTKGISGNGLGLWVSKQIMDRHGGRIRARSRQKAGVSGSVFTLFLPMEK